MSYSRPQQASSSSHILNQLNETPASITKTTSESSQLLHSKFKGVDVELLKEVCSELHVEKGDDDFEPLIQMVNDFLNAHINEKNTFNEVNIKAFGSSVMLVYINYKIQQQVTSISSDKNNPLINETNPSQVILTNIKKIVRYLNSNSEGISSKFNTESLKRIFNEKELSSALYIIDRCPLIAKNDKGNYEFALKSIYLRLMVDIAFETKPQTSAEDKARIAQMFNRRR